MDLLSSQYQISEVSSPRGKKCVLDVHETYQLTEEELEDGGMPVDDEWRMKAMKKSMLDKAWEQHADLLANANLPVFDDSYTLRVKASQRHDVLHFSIRKEVPPCLCREE